MAAQPTKQHGIGEVPRLTLADKTVAGLQHKSEPLSLEAVIRQTGAFQATGCPNAIDGSAVSPAALCLLRRLLHNS